MIFILFAKSMTLIPHRWPQFQSDHRHNHELPPEPSGGPKETLRHKLWKLCAIVRCTRGMGTLFFRVLYSVKLKEQDKEIRSHQQQYWLWRQDSEARGRGKNRLQILTLHHCPVVPWRILTLICFRLFLGWGASAHNASQHLECLPGMPTGPCQALPPCSSFHQYWQNK